MLGYYIGATALGSTIGYLIANSASPVVGIALPLLFSLVGGAGTVYAAKIDINDVQERSKLKFLGVTLTCFSVGLVVFSALVVRLQGNAPELPLSESSMRTPERVDHALQLAGLRLELRRLGASDAEIVRILKAAPSPAVHTPDNPEKIAETAKRIAALIGTLKQQIDPGTVTDSDLKQKVAKVRSIIAYAEGAILATAESLKTKGLLAAKTIEFQLAYLRRAVVELTGGPNFTNTYDYDKLSNYPALLTALLEARAVLEANPINFQQGSSVATFFKPPPGGGKVIGTPQGLRITPFAYTRPSELMVDG